MRTSRPMNAVLLALVIALAASSAAGEPRYPGKTWERAPSPETLGWSAEKLRAARTYSETLPTEPLEMEDFRLGDGVYFRGPESIHAAYPFRMTARDMARFGLLFLRDGQWRGREVVPKVWVEESTRMHSAALGQWGGYGYMWWVAERGPHFASAWFADRVYSARGNGGHYIVVVPSLKLVVVHRVDTDQPRREVTDSQFGHLMQLILDAAPRP